MSYVGSSSSSSPSGFTFKKLTDNLTINLYLELKSIEAEEEADAESSRRPKCSRTHIPRNHEEAHERLWKDYFDSSPRFLAHIFRGRFRMRRELFLKIVNGISNHFIYFQQRYDGLNKKCLSPIHK